MKSRWGLGVIAIAVVWALVIFAVSSVLGDVPQSSRVLQILGGGAAASIILLGGLARQNNRT